MASTKKTTAAAGQPAGGDETAPAEKPASATGKKKASTAKKKPASATGKKKASTAKKKPASATKKKASTTKKKAASTSEAKGAAASDAEAAPAARTKRTRTAKKPAARKQAAATTAAASDDDALVAARAELDAARAELDREKAARAESESRAAALQSKLDDALDVKLSELEAAHRDAIDRAVQLEATVATLRERAAEATSSAAATADLSARVGQLEAELSAAQQARIAAERASAAAADEAAQRTTDSNAKLERDLFDVRARLEREVAIHAATRRQRDVRVAQLEAEIAELRHKVSQVDSAGQRAGALTCPRCGGSMVELVHLGVTLDRCTQCNGLYFDAGELEEVIRAEYPDAPLEAAGDEPAPEQKPVGDAWDEDTLVEGPRGRRRGFFSSLFRRG